LHVPAFSVQVCYHVCPFEVQHASVALSSFSDQDTAIFDSSTMWDEIGGIRVIGKKNPKAGRREVRERVTSHQAIDGSNYSIMNKVFDDV